MALCRKIAMCRLITLSSYCRAPLGQINPQIYSNRLTSLRFKHTNTIKNEKEKLRTYILQRYINYVKNYTNVLEKRFPSAMRMYRVFSIGIKDFLKDLKTYISLRIKITKNGGLSHMSRQEIELYQKMPSDMWRIAPVLVLSALPFANYIIFPLAFLKPKTLLCSHFWSIQQRAEYTVQDLQDRLKNNKPVLRALQAKIDTIETGHLRTQWKQVLGRLGSGVHPTVEEVLACKDLFSKKPYHLSNLTYNHMGHLLKMHGCRKGMFRMKKLRYRAFILIEMDKAIIREGGVETLGTDTLRNACQIRGLNSSHLSNQDMRNWLQQWLQVSQNIDPSTFSLLLHCPILFAYNHPQNWATKCSLYWLNVCVTYVDDPKDCQQVAVIYTQFDLSESKKPLAKRLQATWRLECDLGIRTDSDCPQDGGWSPWAPWSICQGACDNVGHRKRVRECNNPFPSKEGMPCSGFSEQIETCYFTNCSVNDFRNIVEGDSARSEALHQLEAVPVLMEKCLQIECPFEAVEATLAVENTWQINSETVWNALQCVKHDVGCSVIGEWGVWGPWSSCGARCGNGLRWRLRRCDTPPPSFSNLVCSGMPLQHEKCEGDQCAIDEQNAEHSISGSWSDWGAWTECSEKCGFGVRRRKRSCIEKHTSINAINWGTHCKGQYDELDVCYNTKCLLDGGWSGWGPWGPCSQTCGAGRRSRTRSCTRPIPAGNGTNCVGLKVEVGTCHLAPCEVFTHMISLFNGDSFLHYNFPRKRSTFFHFYVRFMPLSPHGTLVRRGSIQNPSVRLSLQKWHVCLDANGLSKVCSLPRMCSPSALEPAVWHTILMTVTNKAATIRLNDAQISIRNWFSCDPELEDDKMNIFIGEKWHGEIHEVMLNFIPLSTFIERERKKSLTDFYPSSASNMAYEKASIEEAYLTIQNDQYLRLPCFIKQEEWQIELTIKSRTESGTILVLPNNIEDNWLFITLQNMRIKIKFVRKEFKSESISSTECLPDQWLDIIITKKKETNTVEASINAGERLHVLLSKDLQKRKQSNNNINKEFDGNSSSLSKHIFERHNYYDYNCINKTLFGTCKDEFFIGGVPISIKKSVSEDLSPFSGTVASVRLNGVLLDLHEYSMERNKDGLMQLSSRTSSISGSYHEISWGESHRLNLTCLHPRSASLPHIAYWLNLDTEIRLENNENVRSVNFGRLLRLIVLGDKDLRGFYTCRTHSIRRTRNIVTYGVLGKIRYKILSPDTLTVIAICTTLSLVIFTLSWLIIEGYHDLRNGYGFFRDAHFSPEEEAEIVCQYIDQNMHLLGTQSEVNRAKAKARQRGMRLASRISFGAQEPEGMLEINEREADDYSSSEPEGLPALPEIKSSGIEISHEIYRCEPSYISSPRHGSFTSPPKTKLSSTSSLDSSPRVLCSLHMRKFRRPYKENERKRKSGKFRKIDSRNQSNLLTIKSSTLVNKSPAHKVLEKFHELKSDDS